MPDVKILNLSFPVPLAESYIPNLPVPLVESDQVLVPILYVPAHTAFHLEVEAPKLYELIFPVYGNIGITFCNVDVPTTERVVCGVDVPIPNLFVESFQKKLALSWVINPFAPINATEPCVKYVAYSPDAAER